ncbi:arylamine N-acetyltransferase family protein [Marinivivus vitaminiproducens]|uniref:arylamine N-acetyltransferase family protein n=1 Tax=Marinivivus vitaminiproducens TaxID=3035935 RepID=UPI002799BB5E|nr:arylamine N-acetyltransferase [Geminicoccaceae bacterium SCSIO 64248]
MTAQPTPEEPGVATHGRVLVLGRAPEVMETVLAELVSLGVDAVGSTEPETAPTAFDARAFDLVAIGGGLRGPVGDSLRAAFLARNPSLRVIDASAPTAAVVVRDALRGTPQPTVDLDAYCARIGYDGPRTPSMETLRALQRLHTAAIPFEAIDVLLGKGVDIAPEAVDAKLIGRRRGGYCFEQNGLFRRVLRTIGFEVEGLAGRVRWMLPADAPRPARTHMVLRVVIDGHPWLADVGFGVCVPTEPLDLRTTEPQPTAHETFRLFPYGGGMLLQAKLGEAWASVYEFGTDPVEDIDYVTGNWFTSTHPGSHFRSMLNVACVTDEARYTLRDNRLTVRTPDGGMDRRQLDADALERVLAERFGLPVEPEWRTMIGQAVAVGSKAA